MNTNNEVTSKVPMKSLYGVDEKGTLFIIEPEDEFNIFRLSKIIDSDNSEIANSSSLGVDDLKLTVNGDVKAVYSLPDFGLFIDEAIKGMLKDDIEDLKEIRQSILKRLSNDEEFADD